jgi:hypothetical protein
VLSTPDEVHAELTDAGFVDVEVRTVDHAEPFGSVDELWGSLTRTMAPLVLMQRRLGDRWPAVAAAGRAGLVAGLGGDGPGELPMPALLGVGTRR